MYNDNNKAGEGDVEIFAAHQACFPLAEGILASQHDQNGLL